MAHFVKINEDNVVEQAIVVANECAPDEQTGQAFLASIGFEGTWLQTSYNTREGVHILGGTPFRHRYAGIGYVYDPVNDVFISTKPFESWILNKQNYVWQPPIPRPTDGKDYRWDEPTLSWVEIEVAP